MVDWSGLAATKYAIEQQNADSARLSAEGTANLHNATAATLGPQAAAKIALDNAQKAHLAAQTDMLPQQMLLEQQNASVNRDKTRAETDTLGSELDPGGFDLAQRVASQTYGYQMRPPGSDQPSGVGVRYGKSSTGTTMSPGYATPGLKSPFQTIGKPAPAKVSSLDANQSSSMDPMKRGFV
jgi:hypothetical protein